ncbi:IS4 family transposase [Clostridium sp. ZS2-4]|uniref:IS4 family transposase n=1 Tax=Clostridium sp. ZS2-4 TaxID=2987703 RepID=UPI00227A469C|nr:IS4 family transposase [Clostridium sp. ZS2-4]MCY6355866.1 IS4 family transposase [Clostridium sp. ZS2-4]
MSKINRFKKGIQASNQIIDDIMFLYKFRMKETYFTRMGRSKMKFTDIILFILNFVKKSLQIELDDFFKNVHKGEVTITKQAFSQARRKVSPEAFIYLLDGVNKWFYNDTPFNKYRGYRLLAIDGTVLQLHNSENLREVFGYIENQNSKVARAQASALYDVENDMIIASKITHYKTGERAIAKEMITKMCELGTRNDLLLFDRGYPSRDFIQFIEEKQLKYLMRVSSGFLKVVVNAPDKDQVIEVKYKGELLKMRVLKFELNSGVIETLITNIFDEDFSVADFKELYFKRWGIEVKYNEIKNKLQVENFAGETPIAIEQDFYATMYLSNMVALAKMDANEIIEEEYKNKGLKYEYKVNTNVLIGKLKNTLITMISINNPWKRSRILKHIEEEIQRNVIPIRPDRSFERKENKSTQMVNRMNKKRAL